MSKYTAEQVEVEIANYAEEAFPREEIDLERVTDMLRDYAALLRERESTKAADTPRNEFPLLYDNLDALDERAAEQPSRIATTRILAELRHQIGYVMTKLYGERATLEAVAPVPTKAAVTDEMVSIAIHGYDSASPSFHPSNKAMRAALEAVAPMLASARVLGGWKLVPVEATDEMCEAAWESDASDYVGEHRRIHRADLAYKAMLAAAPKPETEE